MDNVQLKYLIAEIEANYDLAKIEENLPKNDLRDHSKIKTTYRIVKREKKK